MGKRQYDEAINTELSSVCTICNTFQNQSYMKALFLDAKVNTIHDDISVLKGLGPLTRKREWRKEIFSKPKEEI